MLAGKWFVVSVVERKDVDYACPELLLEGGVRTRDLITTYGSNSDSQSCSYVLQSTLACIARNFGLEIPVLVIRPQG